MEKKQNYTTPCLIVGEFLDDAAEFTQESRDSEQQSRPRPSRYENPKTHIVLELVEDAAQYQQSPRNSVEGVSQPEILLLMELMKEWKGFASTVKADDLLSHLEQKENGFPIQGIAIRLGLASLELKGLIQSTMEGPAGQPGFRITEKGVRWILANPPVAPASTNTEVQAS